MLAAAAARLRDRRDMVYVDLGGGTGVRRRPLGVATVVGRGAGRLRGARCHWVGGPRARPAPRELRPCVRFPPAPARERTPTTAAPHTLPLRHDPTLPPLFNPPHNHRRTST